MLDRKIVVSFIMPVYNGERYLKRSIESIINQPNKNYELIIINDGSSDDSIDIINKYANEYRGISLIDIDNHGVNYARNLGIKTAKGKFLCFIDQDDFVFNNTFNDELVNKLLVAYDENVDFYTMKNIVSNETCNRYFQQDVGIITESKKNGNKVIYGLSTLNPLFAFYNSNVFKIMDLSIFEKYRNTDTDMQLFHLFYYYSKKYIFDNELMFYCWVNNLQSVSHDISRLSKSHYDTLSCWKEIAEIHMEKHKDIEAMRYCVSWLCGAYYYFLLSYFRRFKNSFKIDKVIDEFNDYIRQNYKEYAWGKPKDGLELYYNHKRFFKFKCYIKSVLKNCGQRIRNNIPFFRDMYEKKKFPLILDNF